MSRAATVISIAILVAACSGELARDISTTTAIPILTVPTTVSTTVPAASSTTSPTTIPAGPDTSVPALSERCPPDPFDATFEGDIRRRYGGKLLTAHVYDIDTGCRFSYEPENRQPTASVFKVLVMAGTLLEAQGAGRDVTNQEMDRLTPMITESANWPVRSLWRSFGAAPWFSEQKSNFALNETSVTADGGSAWGLTRTSAADQVELLRQVLLGEYGPLEEAYRNIALELMTSVVDSQTWGVTAGIPDHWTVAQKNGFAGATINSVGWVDDPGPEQGYVVAILSTGWRTHAAGIEAVERVSVAIAHALTKPMIPVE